MQCCAVVDSFFIEAMRALTAIEGFKSMEQWTAKPVPVTDRPARITQTGRLNMFLENIMLWPIGPIYIFPFYT